MPIGELLVIDAEAMQHGRVEVMDVDGLVDDVVAEVIRFSVNNSGLYTATCHPLGVATWVVVPAVVGLRQSTLAIDSSPEFSAPDHQCVVKHATLLEVI